MGHPCADAGDPLAIGFSATFAGVKADSKERVSMHKFLSGEGGEGILGPAKNTHTHNETKRLKVESLCFATSRKKAEHNKQEPTRTKTTQCETIKAFWQNHKKTLKFVIIRKSLRPVIVL